MRWHQDSQPLIDASHLVDLVPDPATVEHHPVVRVHLAHELGRLSQRNSDPQLRNAHVLIVCDIEHIGTAAEGIAAGT